ncbi:hypothetical protein AGMMS50289_00790 [Betaproteobacteria bacterium]|nr:hypothetical protein AGMMS50289_00790 [Betaproteobacteria bacterium]
MQSIKLFPLIFAVSAVLLPMQAVRADTADTSGESECGDTLLQPETPDGFQDAWSTWTACLQKHRPPRIDKVRNASEVARACSENFFHTADVNDCLVREAKESNVRLQQAEKKLRATMDEWDEEDEYVRRAKRQLTASGKAFAMYRTAMCTSFARAMGGGGRGRNTLENACLTEQNDRRAEQLLGYARLLYLRGQSSLKRALMQIEGRFDWQPDRNAYVYSRRVALGREVRFTLPFEKMEDERLPAEMLAELVDCLDDTSPSSSTLNDQPVPLGWVCHAALTAFINHEEVDAEGDIAPGWAGYPALPASPQTMSAAKTAWQKVITNKQYTFY